MKDHRPRPPDQQARDEAELFTALLALENADEVGRFLHDLLTPAELQAMADRWRVVRLLAEDLPYRRIHELTGVSVTTIGRVARFVTHGNGGYTIALERCKD